MINQNKIKCRFCEGENIVKWCKRKTQNRGEIQRYKCKDCGKYFSVDDGFLKMKNNPQKVTLCLDLFYRGISTRKVQEHLQAFYPHNSSCVSIYKWVVKYAKKIGSYTDKLKVKTGEEIEVDEIEYHRRKCKSGGVSKDWYIDSIDKESRYMIAGKYFNSRGKKQIREIFNSIKNKTDTQIKTVTTDGWKVYKNVVEKTFGYNNKTGKFNVVHHRNVAIKEEGFNYSVERLHNNIRARTKVMRGFHGSVSSADAVMKGYEIYYNFIRKHMAINKCPYELATDLKLTENNKWLELIKLSRQSI